MEEANETFTEKKTVETSILFLQFWIYNMFIIFVTDGSSEIQKQQWRHYHEIRKEPALFNAAKFE